MYQNNKLHFIYETLQYYYLDDTSENNMLNLFNSSNFIKQTFNLNENIVWINLHYFNLYNDQFDSNFIKIKTVVNNTNYLILWLIGYHMPINYDIINNLNKLCDDIRIPVLLCLGSLGNWDEKYKDIMKFNLWKSPYYEYESYQYNLNYNNFNRSKVVSYTNNTKKTKKFLFMGTKDYPNRKYLLSNIINNGLLNDGYVSYKQVWGKPLDETYLPEQISHINNIANSIDHLLPLPNIDDSIEYTEMSRTLLLNSYVNMVTDTFFEISPDCTFLSEKVFNAIAHWQIFIIMAPPHTLSYLKSIGYKTFDHIIDESYDAIENNYERILAVTNSFIRFVSQPIEVIQQQYIDSLSIIEHNRSRLFQCNFEQKLAEKLK